MTQPHPILVAPNVSEQIGGEAIKVFQIASQLSIKGVPFSLITHERCASEVRDSFPGVDLHFATDSLLQRLMWKSVVLRLALNADFQRRSRPLIRAAMAAHAGGVVHYVTPVSPIQPTLLVDDAPILIGPLTGSIYYPPAFQSKEPAGWKASRLLYRFAVPAHRLLHRGKRRADRILVSGAERTRRTLLRIGCRDDRLHDFIDSGVKESFLADQPTHHEGTNLSFVHNGRLARHKGTDLAIEALLHTTNPVTLDIIGRGEAEDGLKELTTSLGLDDRVRFRGWVENHADLPDILRQYRGFVFPSLAEANGIVVQEAMSLGLPVVALDWGGPSLLVEHEHSGILIPPDSHDRVVRDLAAAMDRLASDPALTNGFAREAHRVAAAEFAWPVVVDQLVEHYRDLVDGSREADGSDQVDGSGDAAP